MSCAPLPDHTFVLHILTTKASCKAMRKLCIREPRELSRKLAVASLALLLLQQGEGQV